MVSLSAIRKMHSLVIAIAKCQPANIFPIRARCLICLVILLHEKFLQFDWFRAVVFQLNLKYLHVKVTHLLRVVV